MRSTSIRTVFLVYRSSKGGEEGCTPYLVCKTRRQADTAADHIEKWMQALSEILPKVPEVKESVFVPDSRRELVKERSAILDVVQWPYNIERLKQTLPLDKNGGLLPGQVQVMEVPVLSPENTDPS